MASSIGIVIVLFAFLCGPYYESEIVAVGNSMGVHKLFAVADEEATERIGDSCSTNDIAVYQGATTPLPNGIPTYTVQILNVCMSGCTISDIHVSCGWFSSARMVNPRVFRRIAYDDCLVNDGRPLAPGSSLSFQYANSFTYPLSVAHVNCH